MPVQLTDLVSSGFVGYTGSRGVQGIQGRQGIQGTNGDFVWLVRTSNYTASNKDAIVADTTAGTFTITLPPSPVLGNAVTIADGGNWANNNLLVARNGSTIEGVADDFLLNVGGTRVDFIYDGSTWEVYSSAGQAQISNGVASDLITTNDTTSNVTFYPVFVSNVATNSVAKVSTTKLYFNASSGRLSANEFNALSDENKKTDFIKLDNALEVVNKMNGYQFKWIDSGETSYGVIAQEIEEIAPEIVNDEEDFKTVNYDAIIPFLIEAVKTLSKEVDSLNTLINNSKIGE